MAAGTEAALAATSAAEAVAALVVVGWDSVELEKGMRAVAEH